MTNLIFELSHVGNQYDGPNTWRLIVRNDDRSIRDIKEQNQPVGDSEQLIRLRMYRFVQHYSSAIVDTTTLDRFLLNLN